MYRDYLIKFARRAAETTSAITIHMNILFIITKINPYSTNVRLLYPLKTSENFWFLIFFRVYRSGTLVEDGVITKWSRWSVKFPSLRENCPNTEFFLVRIFPHSDWMQENTDQIKLCIWTLFAQWVLSIEKSPSELPEIQEFLWTL